MSYKKMKELFLPGDKVMINSYGKFTHGVVKEVAEEYNSFQFFSETTNKIEDICCCVYCQLTISKIE